MDTKSIKLGSAYAYQRGDELVRFIVEAIITVRNARSGGAPETTVRGYIQEDRRDDSARAEVITVEPRHLKGPFEQFQELAQRKLAEEADKKRKEQALQDAAREVTRALYRLVDKPVPKESNYGNPFRQAWTTIDINKEGVALLLEYFRKAKVPS